MSTEGDINPREVLEMWKQGQPPLLIASKTKMDVGEVYRLLRSLEKKIVKEKGVENYGQRINI